jgi:predicted nucleotidyltransferase
MCNPTVLDEITQRIVRQAKDSLGGKLDKVILYGSYARGDYDAESDIDIMILADIPLEKRHEVYKEYFLRLSSDLDLEHNVLTSVNVTDTTTFYKFLRVEPFYQSVMKDGVVLYA